MRLCFGGEADLPLGRSMSLSQRLASAPSLFTPLRIGGLLSLHRQGWREEFPWGGSRTKD